MDKIVMIKSTNMKIEISELGIKFENWIFEKNI